MRIRGSASTSYSSSGAIAKPRNFDRELASSITTPMRELVPELGNRRAQIQTFSKMARTDAITSVSLRVSKVPVQGAEFYIDPMGEEDLDLEVAEFVTWNIEQAMSSPWAYVLKNILKMVQNGCSMLEPVYIDRPWRAGKKGSNTKKYTTLRKLAPRPAINIKEIETDDNGGPKIIKYNNIDAKGKATVVDIPIEKAIIFTNGDTENLFGESILRSAYSHWYYKTHLYKVDAIQKERHGIGVPLGRLPPGYNDDDKKYMNELLANIRANEKAHITLPPGYDVMFVKPEGQMVDVLKSAHYHDVAILLNVMAEFMMLGVGGSGDGGGRATSAAQLDIFYKSELFIANSICDYLNMYLVPNLVLWNYETDVMPQMKVRNIGQSRDLQMLSAALASMADKEYITPDLPTEQFVRGMFDMPNKEGERPEISPTQIRENVLLQGQFQSAAKTAGTPGGGGSAATKPAQGGGSRSTVGNNGGQGNMGKAPTQP